LLIITITLLSILQYSICGRYHGALKEIGDAVDGPGGLHFHDLPAKEQIDELLSRCDNTSEAEWIVRDLEGKPIPEEQKTAEVLCNEKMADGTYLVRQNWEPNSCWTTQTDNWYQEHYEMYENDKEELKTKNEGLFNLFEKPINRHYSYATDGNVHNFYSSFCGKLDQNPRCERICIGYKSMYQREKKKEGHTLGLTARIEYKVDDLFMDGPYTGIFKHGGEDAIIRVSSLSNPKAGFKPSFAMKFFRNNNRSADILAIKNGAAEENLNFFAHGMSNMLQRPPVEFMESPENWQEGIPPQQLATLDPWFNMLGLSESGNNDETGKPLNIPKDEHWFNGKSKQDWKKVTTPFRIFFEPTQEAHDACEGSTPAEDP